MEYPIYQQDREFLEKHTSLIELSNAEGGRVLVAPAFQSRVMTSSIEGDQGTSFGWLNRPFISAGQENVKINNYGGEDRFWLGPEAGQFGLWFKPGDKFDLEDYRTPPGFNSGPFRVDSRSSTQVVTHKDFPVRNYSGTTFDCHVERTIDLLGSLEVSSALAGPVPPGVKWVGFQSINRLTNAGSQPWTEAGGLLSIWNLGMFNPLPRGKVIVPFIPGSRDELGPEISEYFCSIPADRLIRKDRYALFTCDGQMRTKIGVSPKRARNVIGSWDPDGQVLTIVAFNLPKSAADLPYVNSQWEIQKNRMTVTPSIAITMGKTRSQVWFLDHSMNWKHPVAGQY